MNPPGPSKKERFEEDARVIQPLTEEDFVQKSPKLGPFPLWLWLFLLSTLLMILIGTWDWYHNYFEDVKGSKPFLEVTNRQFSTFLWQFPGYIKVNSPIKTGYLPGFEANTEGVKLSETEKYVSAPPDLLFLYHTWSRLLAPDYIPRPIEPKSFEEFLNQTQEWLPDYWKDAPKEYAKLISSNAYKEKSDLQPLSEAELPIVVRQSYEGWKNYYEEGPDINSYTPTYAEVKAFLDKYPHYARNYWRNIEEIANQQVAGEKYLASFLKPIGKPEDLVPSDQIAPFLKVALYNAKQSQQGK